MFEAQSRQCLKVWECVEAGWAGLRGWSGA